MAEKMTMREIETRFKSEWILIVNPTMDKSGEVTGGTVVFHSKDRDEMYRKAIEIKAKHIATHYTGKMRKGTAIVL